MNKALDSPEFSRDCEPAYLNSVSDFVIGFIIEPMVKTRKKYGLYEAREWEEETDGMDLDIGADGESFAADPLLPCRCGSLTGIRAPRFRPTSQRQDCCLEPLQGHRPRAQPVPRDLLRSLPASQDRAWWVFVSL